MTKRMTFLFAIEDATGKTIDFERFTYKRATTCVNAIIKLYRDWWNIYKSNMERAAVIVVYETPDGYHTGNVKFICTAGEFMQMLKEYDNQQPYQNLA